MPARPAYILLLLLMILAETGGAWASPVPVPKERREIPTQKIDAYRSQRSFRYEHPPPRNAGVWERFWRWLIQQAEEIFTGHRASQVLDVLKWLLPAIILGYAVMRIAGMEHVAPWRKRQSNGSARDRDPGENIHVVDFDAGIAAAESESRYRDAVRLLYLKTLKILTDAGRIEWKPDKTNADYAAELIGSPIAPEFSSLTYIYECVWYGELPVNGDAYTKIKPGFLGFREQLRS